MNSITSRINEMDKLTASQADELATQFLLLAQAIGDFRYRNWKTLSKAQHRQLASQHWSVLNYGEDILAISTGLTMTDVERSLTAIREVTGEIKESLSSMASVQKGIKIAGSAVTLGASIVSKNPFAVVGAINELVKAVKT